MTTTTTALPTGTWAIDPAHSSIAFSVRHLMVSRVRGVFGTFDGAITVDENGVPAVSAEIAVDSVDSRNEQRDAHLRSADFFDTEKFPAATFTSTAVQAAVQAAGDDYVLDGDFTLKGVTRPVSLTLEFNGTNPGMGNGEVAGFTASVTLNRKEFGIDIDMPLETGGAVIGDKVTITLEIEAVRKP
ncbi:YceI family protein [Mycobacterium sp. ITM-2016-00317]|uniref:YceI family protein n=1 Tax=Mycobacterium sp. ITM-2016-00317 TaxID=2099694 RepID=UPI000D43BAD1|nr:YceI family protein [Mycobacterium sp. ITM-2016-00317]WNG86277.1 YceI family protein [Mycobacterium sp. ITM-2016-00317]